MTKVSLSKKDLYDEFKIGEDLEKFINMNSKAFSPYRKDIQEKYDYPVVYYPGALDDVVFPMKLCNYKKLIICDYLEDTIAIDSLYTSFNMDNRRSPPLKIDTDVHIKNDKDMRIYWYILNIANEINMYLHEIKNGRFVFNIPTLKLFNNNEIKLEFDYLDVKREILIYIQDFDVFVPEKYDIYIQKGVGFPSEGSNGWNNLIKIKPLIVSSNDPKNNKHISKYIRDTLLVDFMYKFKGDEEFSKILFDDEDIDELKEAGYVEFVIYFTTLK